MLKITRVKNAAATTLIVSGRIDAEQLPDLRRLVEGEHVIDVVLDLSEVSFIDSSGIHAVVETSKRCAELETRLVVVPGPPAVQRLFDLCGLVEHLQFAAEESPAKKREVPQP